MYNFAYPFHVLKRVILLITDFLNEIISYIEMILTAVDSRSFRRTFFLTALRHFTRIFETFGAVTKMFK